MGPVFEEVYDISDLTIISENTANPYLKNGHFQEKFYIEVRFFPCQICEVHNENIIYHLKLIVNQSRVSTFDNENIISSLSNKIRKLGRQC